MKQRINSHRGSVTVGSRTVRFKFCTILSGSDPVLEQLRTILVMLRVSYVFLEGFLWGRLCTYVVEDVHPALHGDALEHGEHGEQDVVKVGDAVVGSDPVLPAHRAVGTRPGRRLHAAREVCRQFTWEERTSCFTTPY